MDIENLVNRITQEVIKEMASPAVRSAVDAAQLKSAPSESQKEWKTRDGKTCLLRTTGECGGVGCCAELVPGAVREVLQSGADRVGNRLGGVVDAADIAARIDHTLLAPTATSDQIRVLCREAREHQFASVCVNPAFVPLAAELLRGSPVKVCTVVGFPLGATTTFTKEAETKEAVANGADEIDMVINIGALKNGEDHLVEEDMVAVVRAAGGRITKAIFETALLSDDEVIRACRMAKRARLDYVKTSTGFGPGGATVHHVSLMRKTVGRSMGVKASGGVRDLDGAREMIKAGATRIGASASVKIVSGEVGTDSY